MSRAVVIGATGSSGSYPVRALSRPAAIGDSFHVGRTDFSTAM